MSPDDDDHGDVLFMRVFAGKRARPNGTKTYVRY